MFGHPVSLPRSAGNRPHVPTAHLRDQVRQLAARTDITVEGIAAAIGLGATTLVRHYGPELGERRSPGRAGRPRHRVTDSHRSLVATMAWRGATSAEIAKALNITPPTLHRHYGDIVRSMRGRK